MDDLTRQRPPLLSPIVCGIVLFTASYMSVALYAAIRYGNTEFKIYLAVMTAMLAAVLTVHSYVRLNLPTLLGLSLWGAAHMAGGLWHVPDSWTVQGSTRVLYNWWIIPGWLKFDQLVHFNGFALVTWICWQCLAETFRKRGVAIQPTFGLLAFCVAAGTGFGAFNEVIEFLATRILPETNVGGFVNTGWDLVANLLGSITIALLIPLHARLSRSS